MERLLRRPVQCLGGGEQHMLGPTRRPDSLFDETASSLMDLILYYAHVDGQEYLTIFLTENYRGHPGLLMVGVNHSSETPFLFKTIKSDLVSFSHSRCRALSFTSIV